MYHLHSTLQCPSDKTIRPVQVVHQAHTRNRYPNVPDGASRIGVDHTAAKFDGDDRRGRRWRRRWRGGRGRRRRIGGGQLSAVASNAGDDARTNRDEAKMSQHVPVP